MIGQTHAIAIFLRTHATHTIQNDAILHQQNVTAALHRLDDDRHCAFLPLHVDMQNPLPFRLAHVRHDSAFDLAAKQQS